MVNRPSVASDEQMAAEALRGDQEAFTHLYQQYFDQVYDLAARVLKDSAAASDVAQNVFMKFLGGTEVKPPQVSFRAWLYTMTRNAAIDELRRRQRLVPMAGPEMEDTAFIQVSTSVQGDPERMALDNDLAALVWEAAQSLNPNDYTLLDLNIRKGLEPDELADALGISRGNVYTRLSRLRDSLEEAVTTLILARRGRQDCSQLNELLLRFGSSESVELTPRSRRAVSRHIAECPIYAKQTAGVTSLPPPCLVAWSRYCRQRRSEVRSGEVCWLGQRRTQLLRPSHHRRRPLRPPSHLNSSRARRRSGVLLALVFRL
jgi:RNA polymerase sigma factor (sigma-70 family)